MTRGARARLRGQPGITERSAYGTVTGPAEAGYEVNKEQAPQPLPDPGTPDAAESGSQERIAGDVLALLAGTPAGRNGALLDPTDASRSCAGDGLNRRRDANRAVSRGVVMHRR
jgi:hypothetical protein